MLRPFYLVIALSSILLQPSCSVMKNLTPKRSWLPPAPKFSWVKRLWPWGQDEAAQTASTTAAASPQPASTAFNPEQPLHYAQNLRIIVYSGSRDLDRLFRGNVTVDNAGLIDLDEVGTAKVGGSKLPQSARSISATFRLNGRIARQITTHIESVDDIPVIWVTGDVAKERFCQFYEGMTLQSAIQTAGGRKARSAGRSIYLTRDGMKKLLLNFTPEQDQTLQAGDIIELSPEI
jgi:protein involved in polysaccharide export with SLBB domain